MSIVRQSAEWVTAEDVAAVVRDSGIETSSDYDRFCLIVGKIAPIIGHYCVKNVAYIKGVDLSPISARGTWISTGWEGLPVPLRAIERPADPKYEHLDIPILARDALQLFKDMAGYSEVYKDLLAWWQSHYLQQLDVRPISLPDDGIPNSELLYFSSVRGGINYLGD